MTILLFVVIVFLQIGPPGPPPVPVPIPAPAPAPAPRPMTGAELGGLLYEGAGFFGESLATEGFSTVNQIWSLPDFLANRSPQNTVDQPEAAQLNRNLVLLAAGLTLAAMGLVVGERILRVLRGEVLNPMLIVVAVVVVGVALLAAVNNRYLQHLPIDLVNLILQTISGGPIHEFVSPGFHLAGGASRVWAAVFALALIIITLGLTVVLFIESVWCLVLGTAVGLFLMGLPLPMFGVGCRYLLGRWMGSLFSPVVVFLALRLASPSTSFVAGLGAPDLIQQLLMLGGLFVAWQAPGVMVGAISVSFPSVSQAYMTSRLVGFGRLSERMNPRAGGGGGRDNPPRSRSEPPSSRGPGGPYSGRMGRGMAAGNRGLATA